MANVPRQEQEQQHKKPNFSLKPAYVSSMVVAVGVSLVFVFQRSYPSFIGPFSNVITPIFACGAVVSSGFALKKYGLRLQHPFSLAWLYFTLGMLGWFLGEVNWAVYNFVLNVQIPYPSVADIFYVAGYFPLILGLSIYVRIFAPALSRQRLAVSLIAILVSGILVSVFLLTPPLSSNENLFTKFFDLGYPSLDLVLLSVAILGFAIFIGGTIGKSWVLLLGAVVLNVVADLLFSYETLQGTYYNGNFDDLLFLWGYVFFALAFYVHKKEL